MRWVFKWTAAVVVAAAVALAYSSDGTHANWPEMRHMQIYWSRVINDAAYTPFLGTLHSHNNTAQVKQFDLVFLKKNLVNFWCGMCQCQCQMVNSRQVSMTNSWARCIFVYGLGKSKRNIAPVHLSVHIYTKYIYSNDNHLSDNVLVSMINGVPLWFFSLSFSSLSLALKLVVNDLDTIQHLFSHWRKKNTKLLRLYLW